MKNEEDPPMDEKDSGEEQVIVDSHGISRNLKGQFVAKLESGKAEEDEDNTKTAVRIQAEMISVLREQQRVLKEQVEALQDGLRETNKSVLETQQIVQELQMTTADTIPAAKKMMGEKFDGIQDQLKETMMGLLKDLKPKAGAMSKPGDGGSVGLATLADGGSSPLNVPSSKLNVSELTVPDKIVKIAEATPYLKSLDGEFLLFTAGSTDFECFYQQLSNIEPDVSFISALQYFCILSAQTVGKGTIGTSLKNLRDSFNDIAEFTKVLDKRIIVSTQFTSPACKEAYKMFLEINCFFRKITVLGHDGLAMPNDLRLLRWFFASTASGMYQYNAQNLDKILPILKRLVLVYEILDRPISKPTAMEVSFIKDTGFVQLIRGLLTATQAVSLSNCMDDILKSKVWEKVSGMLPSTHLDTLTTSFDARGIVKDDLLSVFGLDNAATLVLTNLLIIVHGENTTASKLRDNLFDPTDRAKDMRNHSSLTSILNAAEDKSAMLSALCEVTLQPHEDSKATRCENLSQNHCHCYSRWVQVL